MRVMLSGGAPLAQDTHSLCRTCLNASHSGLWLETASCATVTHTRDRNTREGGAPPRPTTGSVEEGSYRSDGQPPTPGARCVGGDNVAVKATQEQRGRRKNFLRGERETLVQDRRTLGSLTRTGS